MPTSSNFSLYNQAEDLAKIMLSLAHSEGERTADESPKILKLPPVFTRTNDSRYGNGLRNLTAMIRVLAEYEDGYETGGRPTLSDLPERYNAHGGRPELGEKDMRRVHNWLQQISFGLRAAVMEREEQRPTKIAGWDRLDVPARVMRLLYENNPRRAFVTYTPDNRYEFKPLRYAYVAPDAMEKWIRQEYQQKHQGGIYGAQPSPEEWNAYGLKGQSRTICAAITAQIETIIREARACDASGDYERANLLDLRMQQMAEDQEVLARLHPASLSH